MAATALMAATAVTAASQLAGGFAGLQAGRAQAKIAGQQAEVERRAATAEERTSRERGRRFRAAQRAAFGASGVTTTGTPGLVLEQTAEEQERDALAIRYGGQVRKSRALSQAALAKQQGVGALIGGAGRAGATLLGSGAFRRKS